MKSMYIVSFGNSKKFRLYLPDGEKPDTSKCEEHIKDLLKQKFPQMPAPDFFSAATLEYIPHEDENKYTDYQELNSDSITQIMQTLEREVDDAESLHRLNSNAPWGGIY